MRYLQSQKTQLALLEAATEVDDAATVDGNSRYGNFQAYYNGPKDDLVDFQKEHPSPASLNFTSIEYEKFPPIFYTHPHLFVFAYWFFHGWSSNNKDDVVKILNSFLNMKYLCSDIKASDLVGRGFNFNIHSLVEVKKIKYGRLVGSSTQRTLYIYIFCAEILPAIPAGFFTPTNITDLKADIMYYEKFASMSKRLRATKHPVDFFKPGYTPPRATTVTTKNIKSSKTTSTSTIAGGAENGSKLPLTKYEDANFERIEFPSDIVSLSSKLAFIQQTKANNQKLKYKKMISLPAQQPSIIEDMLVSQFKQIGFDEENLYTESTGSQSTIGKLELMTKLIESTGSGDSKDELLRLVKSLQVDVSRVTDTSP